MPGFHLKRFCLGLSLGLALASSGLTNGGWAMADEPVEAKFPWSTDEIAELLVQPETVVLTGGGRQGLLATVVHKNGERWDVTRLAEWSTEQGAVAQVETSAGAAQLMAQGDGASQVVVRFAGRQAAVKVEVKDSGTKSAPSFLHDVQPLLTRAGCNQGACHGKNAGQNGFRLSLRGYAPEWDHHWLTREFLSRRIDPVRLENSLLLTKPAGQTPHAGGVLFQPGDRDHTLLLDWLQSGAPGPAAEEPKLAKLSVLTGARRMVVGQTQALVAMAHMADGSTRDVTWLAKFDSNDPSVLSTSPTGLLQVRRSGETAVRVAFEDQVEIVSIASPYDQPAPAELYAERNNFIDEPVMRKLETLRIPPSPLSGDAEFLRRVSLDLVGLAPTADEVRAFLNDASPDKRTKAVDRLMARPEFIDYWTLQLGDLFQNRRERDHDVRGVKGVRSFHAWLRKQVEANRPWDALARDVLTAQGDVQSNPAVGYYIVTVGEKQKAQESEVVASVAQTFLGTRIGCAQCHNHPLEKYTQDDYYHFAGFFCRVKFDRKKPEEGLTSLVVSDLDANQRKKELENPPEKPRKPAAIGAGQPRTGKFLAARALDRVDIEFGEQDDPRKQLAEWMTQPDNPYFAGAMVNRIWKHFLNVGLVEPVDDLRATNPPSNVELWDALNRDFVEHKFDLRRLIRSIVLSRTYQLSSATVTGNQRDARYYSHYFARRLPAEVFLDSMSQATGVPEQFAGYPVGVRAVQLPDPGLNSYFLSLFGRSERVTACACERSGDVTMPQLLHLQNSENLYRNLRSPEGRLTKLLASETNDERVLEDLFLTAFGRFPRPDEQAAVRLHLASGAPRDEVFRDVFWALVNAKEFAFNH